MSLRNIFRDRQPLLGQDPFVTLVEGVPLLIESVEEERIAISTLDSLQFPSRINSTIVWDNPFEKMLWAPELHFIDGSWYIYYTASNGDNKNHRPYALKSDNLIGPYEFLGRVGPDIWGIDMTQFTWKGLRYAVWSGWENNGDEFPQNLYIAVMKSPWEIQERIKLSVPELTWETSIAPIVEGPQAWIRDGGLRLLYAANASWTQEYSTGLLTMVGEDPLNPGDWLKRDHPLMTNAGHGCIVEGYFIFHKKTSASFGWSDREMKSIKIEELCTQ